MPRRHYSLILSYLEVILRNFDKIGFLACFYLFFCKFGSSLCFERSQTVTWIRPIVPPQFVHGLLNNIIGVIIKENSEKKQYVTIYFFKFEKGQTNTNSCFGFSEIKFYGGFDELMI